MPLQFRRKTLLPWPDLISAELFLKFLLKLAAKSKKLRTLLFGETTVLPNTLILSTQLLEESHWEKSSMMMLILTDNSSLRSPREELRSSQSWKRAQLPPPQPLLASIAMIGGTEIKRVESSQWASSQNKATTELTRDFAIPSLAMWTKTESGKLLMDLR